VGEKGLQGGEKSKGRQKDGGGDRRSHYNGTHLKNRNRRKKVDGSLAYAKKLRWGNWGGKKGQATNWHRRKEKYGPESTRG